MAVNQWPREPLQDARWYSDTCRHRHHTREAAERCDAAEWRRRERLGLFMPEEKPRMTSEQIIRAAEREACAQFAERVDARTPDGTPFADLLRQTAPTA